MFVYYLCCDLGYWIKMLNNLDVLRKKMPFTPLKPRAIMWLHSNITWNNTIYLKQVKIDKLRLGFACLPSELRFVFVVFSGLNMTINSHSSSSVLGTRYSPVERLSVLNTLGHPVLPHPSHTSLSSPRSEPIAGPSGLPPVQQVPLVCILLLLIMRKCVYWFVYSNF